MDFSAMHALARIVTSQLLEFPHFTTTTGHPPKPFHRSSTSPYTGKRLGSGMQPAVSTSFEDFMAALIDAITDQNGRRSLNLKTLRSAARRLK
mgnify:CR=1 FL=1